MMMAEAFAVCRRGNQLLSVPVTKRVQQALVQLVAVKKQALKSDGAGNGSVVKKEVKMFPLVEKNTIRVPGVYRLMSHVFPPGAKPDVTRAASLMRGQHRE